MSRIVSDEVKVLSRALYDLHNLPYESQCLEIPTRNIHVLELIYSFHTNATAEMAHTMANVNTNSEVDFPFYSHSKRNSKDETDDESDENRRSLQTNPTLNWSFPFPLVTCCCSQTPYPRGFPTRVYGGVNGYYAANSYFYLTTAKPEGATAFNYFGSQGCLFMNYNHSNPFASGHSERGKFSWNYNPHNVILK